MLVSQKPVLQFTTYMKRLWLFVAPLILLPALAFAQTQPAIVTLVQPSQPSNGQALPGSTVAAVAITVRSNTLVNVTGIKVQKVGSANNAAIARLQVNTDQATVVGTASGFDANNSVTIPVTATTSGGTIFLVSAVMASNLTPYAGQSFELNITGVTSDAVSTSGVLPVYGAQFLIATGVAKPTCSISASTGTYRVGQTVNVSWRSSNATGGTITGIGNVGPSGLQGILPGGQSQTLVGTFTGPGGTGTCSLTLTLTSSTGGTISGSDTVSEPGRLGTPGGGETVTPGVGSGVTSNVSVPNSGPKPASNIIPCTGLDCRPCDLAALAQNFINYLIGLTIPLAAVMFAWAGILYFTSATNEANITKAKAVFKVVLWGFLIAIGAYIAIQLLLRTLLGNEYKNWNSIQCVDNSLRPGSLQAGSKTTNVGEFFGGLGRINTGAPSPIMVSGGNSISTFEQRFTAANGTARCPTGYTYLAEADTCSDEEGNFKDPVYSAGGGGVGSGSRGYAQCSMYNINCSVDVLREMGLSEAQANVMSCVAVTENAGNAVGCSGTGPCGTFQISKTNWRQYAPAECQASNFNNNIIAAQNNGSCNLVTAANMVMENGYQPWTGHNNGVYWNTAARTCVSNYDPTNLR